MKTMKFKSTSPCGNITPAHPDAKTGNNDRGVIIYEVTEIPDGVAMAHVLTLLRQTAVVVVYIIPYGMLAPGRIVTRDTLD